MSTSDLAGQQADLLHHRPQGRHQPKHDPPARLGLGRPSAPRPAPPAGDQADSAGPRTAAVAMAGEKGRQPALAQAARVSGGRVALQEGQRDRRVDLAEDRRRPGPEALELGPQLVGQGHPVADQVGAGAAQRPQGDGLIRVGPQRRKAMGVGASHLGQHVGVESRRTCRRRPESAGARPSPGWGASDGRSPASSRAPTRTPRGAPGRPGRPRARPGWRGSARPASVWSKPRSAKRAPAPSSTQTRWASLAQSRPATISLI